MLYLVGDGAPHDPAYRVPFLVRRERAPTYELVNVGDERLRGIRLTLLGDGRLVWGIPSVLEPADGLLLRMHGDDLARSSVVIVRWLRPSGDEYLWRISL
ncbi:hypothetical protein [Diaminobutyricimonas sp. TR449]|uniref:hypothetical protein n=1 Tax=Diaminobutyricimonas sp. TR449 TaxID=2708076 RepID=UPI00141E21F7|nr:hypothetical protein [Diaminobutyricimonas sp. TR449]